MVASFQCWGLLWKSSIYLFSLHICRQGNCKLTYHLLISFCWWLSRVGVEALRTFIWVWLIKVSFCAICILRESVPWWTHLQHPYLFLLWSNLGPSLSQWSDTPHHRVTMEVQPHHPREVCLFCAFWWLLASWLSRNLEGWRNLPARRCKVCCLSTIHRVVYSFRWDRWTIWQGLEWSMRSRLL